MIGRVHAVVQLRPDGRASGRELIAFVKQQLGSVKAPKQIHFFPSLPTGAVSKVIRSAVHEAILARRESA
jgi:acyl-coenzyme A synthetase/AMP-(fatty) acid ligase